MAPLRARLRYVFWQNIKTRNSLEKRTLAYVIIHVFGKVHGPTSTWDLHDEYLKNILECSHTPQNY